MKLIAAVVLCGIVALTYAETEEQCGCDSLKQCVDEQKAHMKATFHECGQICEAELGNAASELRACFENMTAKMVSFEQEKASCFFDPEHKVCAAPRDKREYMFRKHHGKHHGGSSESDDERDDGEHEEWENRESKHRRHHGERHHSESEDDGEHEEWENHESKHHKHHGVHHNKCGLKHHKNPLQKKMKPFHKCMMQCFHEKHQMAAEHHQEGHHGEGHHGKEHQREEHEHRSGWNMHHNKHHNKHGHHHGAWWMKKCEKQLNCTISKVAVMESMKTCHPKSAASRAKFYEMKIETCECMRDAFKIDAEKMTCEPSHEEGIHHHWNGGHKHVHAGSHFY